uniref:Sphingomyelin synthase-like domain-containing protein n=1 Tax=Chromera velia CCMP2878 TaxID=1169474 RepID=A0A0G4HPP0_9ALVE|eukprot:Cvel_30000.t1-p1 / transcript=Cvel_30000.t1 / gene=Cvel_30000 / organism=Chromera_velia_CCMP2878 / gene_product=hypothetical protein / transcript_product=hypothetical protein / location=Cvel_scaffold4210:2022-4000(-) / protein_length=301 / sequence_SO=supercontig / SO=protein_coding / is_pseudo=false
MGNKYGPHPGVRPSLLRCVLLALRDLAFLVCILLFENYVVQVISLVPIDRTPLTDPVHLWLRSKEWAPSVLYFGRSTLGELTELDPLIGIVVVTHLLHGREGVILLRKCLRTLTCGRLLRICTYTVTILPNPRVECEFHGPVSPFIMHPGGVCADLLFSGHSIFYVMSMITSLWLLRMHPKWMPWIAVVPPLWFLLLVQRVMRTIYEGYHYSVDMSVAVYVTLLIWHAPILFRDLPDPLSLWDPYARRALGLHGGAVGAGGGEGGQEMDALERGGTKKEGAGKGSDRFRPSGGRNRPPVHV